MHAPRRAQYPQIEWIDSVDRLWDTKQGHEEHLSDFYKRFTQECDTYKAQLGSRVFDEACERLSEYVNDSSREKNKINNDMFETVASMMLLRNSDQDKYGSLLETLSTNFSLGNDDYPKTREKALDALANHKLDKKYFDIRKQIVKLSTTKQDKMIGSQIAIKAPVERASHKSRKNK
jgi:hypothetical protein